MKRLTAIALALLLAAAGMTAMAEDASGMMSIRLSRPERAAADPIGLQRGTEITAGTTTPFSGVIGTDLLEGTTTDKDIRNLLEGYATVAIADDQGALFDGTAVRNIGAAEEANGDFTYTIEISQGLTYNDGSPITSKDYLFTILLYTSPELKAVHIPPKGFDHIAGVEAYHAGETSGLAGARYVSDTAFTIRINGESLPYFYGMEILNITPYPYRVIAPGCDVMDDGQGAYIGSSPEARDLDSAGLPYTPGVFDAAMLRETLLNERTGYAYNPRVTAGPYMLDTIDLLTNRASLVANNLYRGNFEGQKPHIQRVSIQAVRDETLMELLADGSVDLVSRVHSANVVSEGLRLADEEHVLNRSAYPRGGLAYLSFSCEQGATSFVSVRRAIARAVDQESFIRSVFGAAYAMPVYGYYGIGQWMIDEVFSEDPENGLRELNVRDILDSLKYEYSLQDAKDILISAGWTQNAHRGRFVEGVDEIRYLDAPGAPIPLVIHWAIPSESRVAHTLKDMLTDAFRELGIGLTITELPFDEMLRYYFRETDRTFDMFFLANNFGSMFDPYNDFQMDEEYQGRSNVTGYVDDVLLSMTRRMRMTDPANTRQYVTNWVEFQRRFVEMMPVAPLYSNYDFDFYPLGLQNYNITQYQGWASAICYAWYGENQE